MIRSKIKEVYKKKSVKDVNWLILAFVFRFVLGYFTLSLVSGYLGPDKFGSLSYVLAIFNFSEILFSLYHTEIFKKKYIDSNLSDGVIKSYIYYYLVMSIVLFSSLNLFSYLFLEKEQFYMMLILSFSLIFYFADVFNAIFAARSEFKLTSKLDSLKVFIFNLLRVLGVLFKINLLAFAFVYALQKVIQSIFYTLSSLTDIKNVFKAKVHKKEISGVIRESTPLLLSLLCINVLYKSDQIMIGSMLGNAELGLYSIVIRLFQPWMFFSDAICRVIFPLLMTSYKNSNYDFYNILRKSYFSTFVFGVLVILFTILYSDRIISLLFSDEYHGAYKILNIHILGVICLFWININTKFEIITNTLKFSLYKNIIGALINLVLNYILIPKFGILGASFASLAAFFWIAFISNAVFPMFRKLFKIQLESLYRYKFILK